MELKKKKVAFLLKNLDGGGAERVASNLTLKLSPEKYDKYLILDNDEDIYYDYDAKLILLGAKNCSSIIGRIKKFAYKIIKVKQIKKQHQFDVVISFLSGSNIINILSKDTEKNIISIRNFLSKEHSDFRGKILNFISKKLYNKSDVVTVVSELGKKDLIDNFNVEENKIKVIYNPYDLDKIKKLSEEEIEDEFKGIFNKPTIINVGRLSEQKGQKYLIDIFKKVQEKLDVNLVILGKGDLENELRQQVKQYGLEDKVFFLGFQKNPYKFIKQSTIFMMTSLFEGFPNVILESMSCGIPVISTDCKSGPREIMFENYSFNKIDYLEECNYGFLFPDLGEVENNEEAINIAVKHVSSLLESPQKYDYFKKKSIERSKDFEIDKMIKEWEKGIN